MIKTFLPLTLSCLLVSIAFAKRPAPVEVSPITVGHLVISVPHFTQVDGMPIRGGIVEAHDSKTKKLVWRVQVYKTPYESTLEQDVQDVFIRTLSYEAQHGLLIISDESERVFVVDLKTQKVTAIAKDAPPIDEQPIEAILA